MLTVTSPNRPKLKDFGLSLSKTERSLLNALRTNSLGETNKQIDNYLLNSGSIRPIWSTPVLYEAPGVCFGPQVKFQNLVFDIPKKYQGSTDIVLTFGNTALKIESELIYVQGTVIHAVQNFPSKNGWYKTEEATGIPKGNLISDHPAVCDDPQARQLYRLDTSYIGAVVRTFDISVKRYGLIIFLDYKADNHLRSVHKISGFCES